MELHLLSVVIVQCLWIYQKLNCYVCKNAYSGRIGDHYIIYHHLNVCILSLGKIIPKDLKSDGWFLMEKI